jgi:hypothetical protein
LLLLYGISLHVLWVKYFLRSWGAILLWELATLRGKRVLMPTKKLCT